MLKIMRKRCTWMLVNYNRAKNTDKKYYLQFSLTDMWLVPKRDTILNGTVTLWGWLFFYVGCDTNLLKRRY
ncbi:hypothetical protein [Romboutsia sp.]|uniref:hypothetical protein n=1 Tax=Romboutsia sp. TaxID=1965302 RepID=UPI002B85BDA3|nr:hypothetical protein [Romboutsia sp.]HSQ89778.1 hypothetical protein [Romboutsia sp.]